MKVGVIGLWHLGVVTAACLAEVGNKVVGYDGDVDLITSLKAGRSPVYEIGLNELIEKRSLTGELLFTADLADLSDVEIAWVTFDTPVDDNDNADVNYVMDQVKSITAYLPAHCTVIISSQLPVGSTRQLQQFSNDNFPQKNLKFAYSPENLRLGKAIEVFLNPDRIVIGIENENDQIPILKLVDALSSKILWMSIESAEMTKHAINAFLANSVVFINEIATMCEQLGASAHEVEKGLKSEERIGPKAYLKPGAAIAGGTLARDLNYLVNLSQKNEVISLLFPALIESNNLHKSWACRKVLEILKSLENKSVAVLGLAYKPGTDTLRRSIAIETCLWLKRNGAKVVAYDPFIKLLPNKFLNVIDLKPSLFEAIENTDAIIISTECVEFTELQSQDFLTSSLNPCIIDPAGFLKCYLGNNEKIKYFSVGESE